MPEVSVTARSGAPEETAADTRVVGLFEGESLPDPELQQLVELGEAKGSLKKVAVAHEDAPGGGRRRVLIAGLGKRDEFDHEKARVAAASVAGRAQEVGAVSLSWASPTPESAGPLVEGTLLSLYKFDRFKSSKDDEDNGPERPRVARAGRRGRGRGRGRAGARGRERPEPRPRPAEPARQRGHADLPRRARRRDRGPVRQPRGGAARPRRHRRPRHGRLRGGGSRQLPGAAPDRAPLLRRQGSARTWATWARP